MDFRYANHSDTKLILYFIKELAKYEKMLDDVVADEGLLKEWIFDKGVANVLFVLEDGKEVGFVLYFYNYSTFVGRAGIYVEDLYVLPKYRGKGYGKGLLQKLANIAVEKGCARMEWVCLDWNKPSIEFYLRIGAKPLSEWTTYRLDKKAIENLAKTQIQI